MDSLKFKNSAELLSVRLAVREAVNLLLTNQKATIEALLTEDSELSYSNDITSRFILYHLTKIYSHLKDEIQSCSHATPSPSSLFRFLKVRPNETAEEIVLRFEERYGRKKRRSSAKRVPKCDSESSIKPAPVPPQVPPFKLRDLRSSSSSDLSEEKFEGNGSVAKSPHAGKRTSLCFDRVSLNIENEKNIENLGNSLPVEPLNLRRGVRSFQKDFPASSSTVVADVRTPNKTNMQNVGFKVVRGNALRAAERTVENVDSNDLSIGQIPEYVIKKSLRKPTIKVLTVHCSSNQLKKGSSSPECPHSRLMLENADRQQAGMPPQVSARWLNSDQKQNTTEDICE
ncbi:unnamed protein product [Enterobius vermicularis]|uniref:LisH domain-containing protein n=1 Tax=Enterobius vermicularis TaxID=51028 RepID=A0A0N4V929_ENTVE|nr:unnamed protein product [Enterobius vermicularis]